MKKIFIYIFSIFLLFISNVNSTVEWRVEDFENNSGDRGSDGGSEGDCGGW